MGLPTIFISAWRQLAYEHKGLLEFAAPVLMPISLAYRGLIQLRRFLYDKACLKSFRVDNPVISIGNLTVGGAGKTPFVMYLTKRLKEYGFKPAIILRGYKRISNESIILFPGKLDAQHIPAYGDEPALLSYLLQVPIGIGADRYCIARLVLDNTSSDILLLDDGFQHLRLQRNIDIVILEGSNPFGNGWCIPYGPLREPSSVLKNVNSLIFRDSKFIEQKHEDLSEKITTFSGDLVWKTIVSFKDWMEGNSNQDKVEDFTPRRVNLLSGIGNPERFHSQAEDYGFVVNKHFCFADHHWFTIDDLKDIAQLVQSNPILTTEKDAIRLLPLTTDAFDLFNFPLHVVRAKWEMHSEEMFTNWLESWLKELETHIKP